MTTVDPPAWITRLHQAQARRGERCRRCGHRKVIDTEAGPHCAAHAAQLPPPIVRRDHDLDLEHDLEHDDHDLEHDLDLEHEDLECMDIDQAERRVDLARQRVRAVRRGATLSDSQAIVAAEMGLQRALNQLAAAWTARLIRDDSAA